MTKKQIIKIVLEKLEKPSFRKIIANLVADNYMIIPKDDKKIFEAFIKSLKDEEEKD
jgi:hypothetical protein